jgi:hypothetical protein
VADPSETTQITRRDVSARDGEDVLAAVHALSSQVRALQAELRTIRVQTRSLPAAGPEAPGWDDGGGGAYQEAPMWVRSLDGPGRRQPAVPRLLLEVVFLAGVAVACAIAKLDTPVIAGVMAAAWVLVVLAEWTAARAERRRVETVYVPLQVSGGSIPQDPSWFAPPVERTSLDVGSDVEDTAAGIENSSA